MKKKLIGIVLGIVVVIIAMIFIAGNQLARRSIEQGVAAATGFPLEIGGLQLGLLSSHVEVANLRLMNPPDFEERQFVELPKFRVDYELGSILAKKPHLRDLEIEVGKIVVVKNAKGETNLKRLKGIAEESQPVDPSKSEPAAKQEFRVDRLRLQVGTLVYKDFSKKTPSERTVPLNIDETFQNITHATDIQKLVLLTALRKAGIPEIDLNLEVLKNGLDGVTDAAGQAVRGATEVLKQGAEQLQKAGKGLLDGVKDVLPRKK